MCQDRPAKAAKKKEHAKSKHGCKHCSKKKEGYALKILNEEGNEFNMFVGPPGVLVNITEHNFCLFTRKSAGHL